MVVIKSKYLKTRQGLLKAHSNDYKLKPTINFRYKIYRKALDEKWLPELSVFLLLYAKYRNKTIYFKDDAINVRLQALGDEIGVSITLIQRMIRKCRAAGLIEKTDTSLVIASEKKQKTIYGHPGRWYFFNSDVIKTHEDMKKFFEALPILQNLNLQLKYIKKSEHLRTRSEHGDQKAMKQLQKMNQQGTVTTLSVKGICKITGRCEETAMALKKFMQKIGLVKKISRYLQCGRSKKCYNSNNIPWVEGKSFFYREGILFMRLSDALIPLHNGDAVDKMHKLYPETLKHN